MYKILITMRKHTITNYINLKFTTATRVRTNESLPLHSYEFPRRLQKKNLSHAPQMLPAPAEQSGHFINFRQLIMSQLSFPSSTAPAGTSLSVLKQCRSSTPFSARRIGQFRSTPTTASFPCFRNASRAPLKRKK